MNTLFFVRVSCGTNNPDMRAIAGKLSSSKDDTETPRSISSDVDMMYCKG